MADDTTLIGQEIAPAVKQQIRMIPDFPRPGIRFKDVTPIFTQPDLFQRITRVWQQRYAAMGIGGIVAIESRGFLFGAPLAQALGVPLYLARKQGKLPGETIAQSYALEYGSATIEMHADVLSPDQRIVVIDDLLATGGTMAATVALVERLGGEIRECTCLVELCFLHGRETLKRYPVSTIVQYE